MTEKEGLETTVKNLRKMYPDLNSVDFNDSSHLLIESDMESISYNSICQYIAERHKGKTVGLKEEKHQKDGREYCVLKINLDTQDENEAIQFYSYAIGVPPRFVDDFAEKIQNEDIDGIIDGMDTYMNEPNKQIIDMIKPENDKFNLFKIEKDNSDDYSALF